MVEEDIKKDMENIVNTSGMVQSDILKENWYKVTTCPSGTPT
jgi:hypothetical protein